MVVVMVVSSRQPSVHGLDRYHPQQQQQQMG
jgi:hypothetical protein